MLYQICAQLLFTPCDNLSCAELVRYHNCLYSYLLRRYLESKYNSAQRADRKYVTLMIFIGKLSQIREYELHIYKEESILDEMSTIMSEVYNVA